MKTPIENISNDAVQSIAELTRAAQTAESIGPGSKPFLVLSSDQHVEQVELLLDRPTRKTGHPQFNRCESFTRYVNEHKIDASRIYVTSQTCLVAVLDHNAEVPGWGQHRATYNVKYSLEWQAWTGKDKSKMTQKEFCEFIEDNNKDVVGRTDMVELVRTLQVNSNVDYKSFERGDNGNSALSFIRTVQSKAGERGEVELPSLFTLNIPAFEGGQVLPITAKLRFDIGDCKLKLWFELQQIQRILNRYTDLVVAEVAKATGIDPFFGTP